MFCKNCGAQLNDNSAFCSNCGAVQTPPVEDIPQIRAVNTPSLFKNKKLLIAAGAALVAILFIVLSIVLLGGKKGAKTPQDAVKTFLTASIEMDIDELLSVMSQYSKNEALDSYNVTDEMLKAYFKQQLSMTNNSQLNSSTLKRIEFTDIEQYGTSDRKDFIEEYFDEYGRGSTEQITDVVEVDFKATYMTSYGETTDSSSIVCICVGKHWYIVTM